MGSIVAVAGNLAAGKSTLTTALARHNGWLSLPTTGYDASYVTDVLRDPARWAFEAQMSFLRHKADAVLAGMRATGTSVLDRSVGEDVDVFARYFHRRGWMDDRAYRLYGSWAGDTLRRLDRPAVVVYCYASPDACAARLAERPRPYQRLYPPDHLAQLDALYEEWWPRADAGVKLRVDTTTVDLRDPAEAERLARRVASFVGARP